jgi:hypothetical protein
MGLAATGFGLPVTAGEQRCSPPPELFNQSAATNCQQPELPRKPAILKLIAGLGVR